jgi:hypothetical protein
MTRLPRGLWGGYNAPGGTPVERVRLLRSTRVSPKLLICRVSTVVVQRFCKPKVGGSSPSPGRTHGGSARPSACFAISASYGSTWRYRAGVQMRSSWGSSRGGRGQSVKAPQDGDLMVPPSDLRECAVDRWGEPWAPQENRLETEKGSSRRMTFAEVGRAMTHATERADAAVVAARNDARPLPWRHARARRPLMPAQAARVTS